VNGNLWSANCISCGVHFEAISVDFVLLISIPVAVQNIDIVFCRVVKSPMLPLRKINTSSTKSKCVRMHLSVILIPCSLPILCSSLISLLSPSMIRKNNKGDRGYPYLRPLSEWKKGDADPLISTLKDMFVMQHMIH